MLIFDVTNQASFKSLGSWKDQFLLKSNSESKDDLPFLVIGNKIDLEGRRQIQFETAKNWCDENGFPYLETSAKTGDGVAKAFEDIAEKYEVDNVDYDKDNMSINENDLNLVRESDDDENDDNLNENRRKPKKVDNGCCG